MSSNGVNNTVSLEGIKVGLVSLGCPKNLVDSEVMLGLLAQAGVCFTTDKAEAEVLLVNTCGFIGPAQQEAINTILELAQYKEKGKCRALIVTGCLVQRFVRELRDEIPEVDALVGTGEFDRIVTIVKSALHGMKVQQVGEPLFLYNETYPRKLSTPPHYAYLKIAEGCNNRCSFCTIPEIRGSFRSRTMDSVLQEAETLVQNGVKEIILIAQDTTRYGEDNYGTLKLAELLKELTLLTKSTWIRWMYGYPNRITEELIRVMAENPQICPYVDLPLQHIDPFILKRMHRPADPEQIKQIIQALRASIPRLALRTSFIVGFPGETEVTFQGLLDFLEEMRFDRVGAFTYSPEVGTAAAQLDEAIPEEVKAERYHRLMELQQKISWKNNQEWIGRTVEVIVEGKARSLYYGRSQREAPEVDGLVYIENPLNLKLTVGKIIKVRIKQADYYDLIGEIKSESTK